MMMSDQGLSARDLHVRLGDRAVLNGVFLDFAPGVVTAIVGPNGAGKSTLLNCLSGLRRPDIGFVALDGVPLASTPARGRAKQIAFLPQTPEISWALDVRTFIGLGRIPHQGAFGLGSDDLTAVEAAITETGLFGLADRIITTLSGGERARALIARALAGQTPWILADEPLTGLDLGHALDALTLLRALATEQGKGVIVTLHDLTFAVRAADRVIVMGEGRVIADGAPTDVLTPAALAKVYGVDAQIIQGVGGPMLDLVGRVR